MASIIGRFGVRRLQMFRVLSWNRAAISPVISPAQQLIRALKFWKQDCRHSQLRT